jgi:hypothetical protein
MTDAAEQLEREIRAVEAEIREAFGGVTREGGVSWSESVIIDGDLSGRTREEARALDTESRWEELVDDTNWYHDGGWGGFNFLDPIGVRYYMAPVMIRCIREGGGEFTSYAMDIKSDFKRGQVSLLNQQQLQAVARFVRLMIAMHAASGDFICRAPWVTAYENFWFYYDRETPLS